MQSAALANFPTHDSPPPASAAFAAILHATIRSAPHHMMVVSKYNVRNKKTDNGELKALVRTHGVLQNLIGYLQMINGEPTGVIEIVGGRRRHTVVGELIAEGDLPDDYQLNYLLVTEDEAIEISLAENFGRVDMHPADVFDAMLALSQHGRAIEDIALAFRLDALEVKRRLKLANVSPRLLDLYRNDEANLDHMMALAVSDDHAAQEQAWDSLGKHFRSPHDLRRLLTAQQINIQTDRVARYVGAEAFEKAGGVVVRDLFSNHGTGYIGDCALLERLALAKLEKQRAKLLKEGVPWVEIIPRADHAALSEFASVRNTPAPLTEVQLTWAAALDERIAALDQMMEASEGDGDEEEWDRLAVECRELAAQRHAIEAGRASVPNPEDKALAGAVVMIDEDGALAVKRDLIRPADKPKMAGLSNSLPSHCARSRAKPVHSDRLTHELTSHRTAALRAEMMDRPAEALVYLTHTLLCKLLHPYSNGSLALIDIRQPALAEAAKKGRAALAFDARRKELVERLPATTNGAELLAWLGGQPQSVVMELMAFCVASSVDAILNREAASPAFTALAQTLRLNMGKWWTVTADNYFLHVSKGRMMAVVKQAVSAEVAVPLEKMKSAAAAEAAERALAGVAWLPEALRAD